MSQRYYYASSRLIGFLSSNIHLLSGHHRRVPNRIVGASSNRAFSSSSLENCSYEPTEEQQKVIESNGNVKVNAIAGLGGETATLLGYAAVRPTNERILYLAFNKSVQMEAQSKFAAATASDGREGGCVDVKTAHSLAYQGIQQ